MSIFTELSLTIVDLEAMQRCIRQSAKTIYLTILKKLGDKLTLRSEAGSPSGASAYFALFQFLRISHGFPPTGRLHSLKVFLPGNLV